MQKIWPLLTLLLCTCASAELRADIAKNTPPGQATMRVYDCEKLVFQATTPGLNAVTESKFSPNGRWLVNLTDQGYVQLWDVRKGERVKTFLADFARVLNADFTPDSKRLVLNFWDERLTTEQRRHWGQYASSLWTLEPLQRLGNVCEKGLNYGYTGTVHFDAAGERMVTASYRYFGGNAAAIYNAQTGKLITAIPRLPYPQEAKRGGGRGTYDARLSPDGTRALVAYVGNWLAEYHAGTGKLLRVRGKFDDAGVTAQLGTFEQTGE